MAQPPDTSRKVIRISRFQIGLNVLLQLLIFTAIVLMVNYLSFRHFKRWDLSRDQKYALSSQTRNLLAGLKKPVRAVIFFSSAAEIAPDVSALLREYEFASNKKFSTEVVDPFRSFTRASELQAKYKFGANENILILDYDGRSKFINATEMAEFETGQVQPRLTAFTGEQAITSALVQLTEEKPSKIYLTAGHGEPALDAQELKVFKESLDRQNIEAAALRLLDVSSIPDDARSVIIVGPKYDFSELEMKLLADYWQKKGRIFVLLDPFAKTPRLADWLSQKGIAPQDDRVIRTATMLEVDPATGSPQLKTGTVTKAVFVVMDSQTALTNDLVGLSKPLPGATASLTIDRSKETSEKVKLIPVLESAEGFWGETDNTGMGDRAPFFDRKKDRIGPLTLAAALEQGGVTDDRVKVETSRLVVVGNSEMLTNNGYRDSDGVTVDLAMNAINWLLDREELVGIAPKVKQNTTLNLDEQQLGQIALAVMGIVPGIVALLGLVSWWQRRA